MVFFFRCLLSVFSFSDFFPFLLSFDSHFFLHLFSYVYSFSNFFSLLDLAFSTFKFNLIDAMHEYGINARLLGLIWIKIGTEDKRIEGDEKKRKTGTKWSQKKKEKKERTKRSRSYEYGISARLLGLIWITEKKTKEKDHAKETTKSNQK